MQFIMRGGHLVSRYYHVITGKGSGYLREIVGKSSGNPRNPSETPSGRPYIIDRVMVMFNEIQKVVSQYVI